MPVTSFSPSVKQQHSVILISEILWISVPVGILCERRAVLGAHEQRLGALLFVAPAGFCLPALPFPFGEQTRLSVRSCSEEQHDSGKRPGPGAAGTGRLLLAGGFARHLPALLSQAAAGRRGEGSGGRHGPVPTGSPPPSPRAHAPAQPESSAILLLMGLAPLKAVCEGIVCNHSKRNIIQRLFRPQKKRQSRVIIGDSPLTRASLLFVCVGLIRAANGAGGGAR